MGVSYNKLWKMLIDKNISKTELTHLAGITTNAMAKLGRNEDVRVKTLEKLCTSLDCKLDDIVEFVPDTDKKGQMVILCHIMQSCICMIWTGKHLPP